MLFSCASKVGATHLGCDHLAIELLNVNIHQPQLESIFGQHVQGPWKHITALFISNNLCKQQLRTNHHRWGYQVGFDVGATTSWEHGQAHYCEAPASLRRQNHSAACLRFLIYMCWSTCGRVCFGFYALIECLHVQGRWTIGNSASISRMTTLMVMTGAVHLSKVLWLWTSVRFLIGLSCFVGFCVAYSEPKASLQFMSIRRPQNGTRAAFCLEPWGLCQGPKSVS